MSISTHSDDDPNRPSERLEARLEELWSMTNTLRQQLEQRDTGLSCTCRFLVSGVDVWVWVGWWLGRRVRARHSGSAQAQKIFVLRTTFHA